MNAAYNSNENIRWNNNSALQKLNDFNYQIFLVNILDFNE